MVVHGKSRKGGDYSGGLRLRTGKAGFPYKCEVFPPTAALYPHALWGRPCYGQRPDRRVVLKKVTIALLWLLLSATAWANNKEDFLAAREAYRTGDLAKVAELAKSLSGDPLGIYPRYWLLSRQLDQLEPAQIQPFLDYYQGSWLAERLRTEWLLSLGRRGNWTLFREQYRLLQDEPSTDLYCYNVSARLAQGEDKVLAGARAVLWFTTRDLPAACGPVLEKLLASGTVSEADIW
ncbi:MAG: slt, partial [Moraxellaceae bacterium]|nr:slt [Moraxellaceae bacterium]